MSEIPEEVVKLAESVEVKVKTTKPQEVAYAVHKGSYLKLGEVFWKSVQWIEENGYEIVGPSDWRKKLIMRIQKNYLCL